MQIPEVLCSRRLPGRVVAAFTAFIAFTALSGACQSDSTITAASGETADGAVLFTAEPDTGSISDASQNMNAASLVDAALHSSFNSVPYKGALETRIMFPASDGSRGEGMLVVPVEMEVAANGDLSMISSLVGTDSLDETMVSGETPSVHARIVGGTAYVKTDDLDYWVVSDAANVAESLTSGASAVMANDLILEWLRADTTNTLIEAEVTSSGDSVTRVYGVSDLEHSPLFAAGDIGGSEVFGTPPTGSVFEYDMEIDGRGYMTRATMMFSQNLAWLIGDETGEDRGGVSYVIEGVFWDHGVPVTITAPPPEKICGDCPDWNLADNAQFGL